MREKLVAATFAGFMLGSFWTFLRVTKLLEQLDLSLVSLDDDDDDDPDEPSITLWQYPAEP